MSLVEKAGQLGLVLKGTGQKIALIAWSWPLLINLSGAVCGLFVMPGEGEASRGVMTTAKASQGHGAWSVGCQSQAKGSGGMGVVKW